MKLIHEDFMLHNSVAKKLYHDYARGLPIIDFHCHLSPAMISENHRFKNATHLFLAGDHYKWRLMRAAGIEENLITGSGSDYDKWLAFSSVVPKTIGNPMYHWIHLELTRYFNIDTLLCAETAKEIWDRVNACLQQEEYSTRGLLKKANVEVVCTTDRPEDSLTHHLALRGENPTVLPTFRPDLNNLPKDILKHLDRFCEAGCKLSDHSVDRLDEETIDTVVMLGAEYKKRDMVMQLHIGALRNNNSAAYRRLGVDAGYDSMNDFPVAQGLGELLNRLEQQNALPKTILYNLNPKDNYVLATMMGNFQKAPIPGKIQFGSGWWFLDQRDGMEAQLKTLASTGLLSTFVGMVTDSRSFVSYTRHEYFRRIFCNLIGTWVEKGEYPNDQRFLRDLVQDVCYRNAKNFFNF